MVDNLGNSQNDGAFMKMVKMHTAREQRKGCQLDPDKMPAHARHFRTTFGGAPTGLDTEINSTTLNQTDPTEPMVPLEMELIFHLRNRVMHELTQLPFGKAAGIDTMPAELLTHGTTLMTLNLSLLFQILTALAIVPTEWRQALVCPVFKKGDRTAIENHRPIALTVVCRRLFERTQFVEVQKAASLLDDFQGGFRWKRSTHDQVFFLESVIKRNTGVFNAYLDLCAAYDMVDRRILWTRLARKYRISLDTIRLLRTLFDHNVSFLVIDGRRSEPIPNLRGLLQGSSLSPILFNFFIDELAGILQTKDKVSTLSIRSNCLLFADDANLHALSVASLQTLLDACQDWGDRVGMKFAPSKCFVVAEEENVHVTMYNAPLPQIDRAKYLGFYMTATGIDWDEHVRKRGNKATATIQLLRGKGMNGAGWPPRSALNVYKTFIRPALEYGLPLAMRMPEVVHRLQKVQNRALRAIYSAWNTTSVAALHRLSGLETMQHRAMELQARYFCKLHNSLDARIPAVRMWWALLHGRQARTSLEYAVLHNPIFIAAKKRDHLFSRLARAPTPLTSEPLTKTVLQRMRYQDIVGIPCEPTSVGAAVPVDRQLSLCFLPKLDVTRPKRILLIMWRLGRVAFHQQCLKCNDGTELSRAHALECAGVDADLARFANLLDPNSPLLPFDQLLNKEWFIPGVQEAIYAGIKRIMIECRHGTQTTDGRWKLPRMETRARARPAPAAGQGPAAPGPGRRIRTPAAERLSAMRAAQALGRNRLIGRPRGGVG
jgi:hypothetical protein